MASKKNINKKVFRAAKGIDNGAMIPLFDEGVFYNGGKSERMEARRAARLDKRLRRGY